MHKIPVYQPSLVGNEKKYVNDCLDANWISSKGKYVQLFEKEFASYVKVNYATGVCNGTVALHLALLALGIGQGDEVIVPTLTYIASVNTITYTGAIPVFVDSLPDTWQIDPEDVIRAITPKTKAILAVHLYGHPCDLSALKEIAKKHRLFLIEDCAEAIGSLYQNQHVGTFGDVATFSFYGNKTITTGEGGMVITNDQTIFDRAVHFKGQGLAKYREYWHDVIGYNYRMTNLCAAIGLAQLEKIQTIIKKKRQIAELYKELLQDTNFKVHPEIGDVFHSYWMVSILVDQANQRDTVREHLAQAGIETRPVFYPVHTMPMYSQKYQKHQVAEDIGWRGINLPSYPDLSEEQIKYICDTLNKTNY
ncbi:DegT/DnrJ/EryC1/StrS family aminotransferase [Laspinema olomoucense]|uniref:DegT/DnrJ/EryC1/StrS aminotransferase family protein n=1 Tax=Laspinema olomoucense D3b TaxID=2953688 RepID=A0ABT2N7P3_9CYAN|nr:MULTISPECIES: DegT/DnrJ/EryC1/StrS aminotransferase family protein [unclassified Laspinema]MCT7977390.1 DegT/DnrJ/EryC1/StrS aminotransferase family protein [Laspinema sp. D3b]MCT7986809.1 DegT/DnrJ/EryC1/StrS aminotransferase family protein [Laspinema sp. D3a]